jgi:thioredoxin-like negative regulator of GroEL
MELNQIINTSDFESILQDHPSVMVYFYQDKCGVCKTLFPKVKELVQNEFPNMEFIVLEAQQNREIAAQLRMLAVPGIVVFFEGKEFLRANGLLSLSEL